MLMPATATRDLLDKAWGYSLMEALYARRTRRFGIGFEMTEGPFRYKSKQAPVGLSEMEEALLIAAGAVFSGLALWDYQRQRPILRAAREPFLQHGPAATRRFSSPTIEASMCSMPRLLRP